MEAKSCYKMTVYIFGLILPSVLLYSSSKAETVHEVFEFEDAVVDGQDDFWMWRSRASGRRVLRLGDSSQTVSVEFTICIDPDLMHRYVKVGVSNMVFSNDGPSDLVTIKFNDVVFSFSTMPDFGNGSLWNMFYRTSRLGRSQYLTRGKYKLNVSVFSNNNGVEVDKIELKAKGQNPETRLICGARIVPLL